MSDAPVQETQVGPEYVAYLLMKDIAAAENRTFHPNGNAVDRVWIINTYNQCLTAVKKCMPASTLANQYPVA